MGNKFSDCYYDHSYKICMICNYKYKNPANSRNDDLEIIKSFEFEHNNISLIFRCSRGHVFKYCGNIEHINYVKEYHANRDKNKLLIEQLKKENIELKEKILQLTPTEILTTTEPSAPLEQTETTTQIISIPLLYENLVTAKPIN